MYVIQELCTSILAQEFQFTQLEANVMVAARPGLAMSEKTACSSAECKTESLRLAYYGFYKQSEGHHLSWAHFACEKIMSFYNQTLLKHAPKLRKFFERLLLAFSFLFLFFQCFFNCFH